MLVATLLVSGCATVDDLKGRFVPGSTASTDDAGDSLVADIERGLRELGYSPGTVDGYLDIRTEAAIQDFQLDHDLRIDGRATPELLKALEAMKSDS